MNNKICIFAGLILPILFAGCDEKPKAESEPHIPTTSITLYGGGGYSDEWEITTPVNCSHGFVYFTDEKGRNVTLSGTIKIVENK